MTRRDRSTPKPIPRHNRSRRTPAVVAASAAGFVGIVAMHAGSTPSMLSTAPGGPVRPASVSASPPTTSAPASSSPPAGSGGTKTALGNSEQYGYGALAVKVTYSAGHITDVSVASLQTAEQYSQSLAQQVIPMLRNEVLSAQSTHINAISGATYTSEAYAYSVQSALDALGVK